MRADPEKFSGGGGGGSDGYLSLQGGTSLFSLLILYCKLKEICILQGGGTPPTLDPRMTVHLLQDV